MDKLISLDAAFKKFVGSGDQDAFQRIFEHLYPSLVQLAFNFTHHRSASEDLVMEVFENLWTKRQNYHKIKNLRAYLYTSVRNRAIDYLKNKKDIINFNVDRLDLNERFVQKSPEKALMEKELFEAINKIIENLPLQIRMIYRMVKEEGLSYREVAEILDIPTKTVDNHIYSAMKRIRDQVRKYMDTNSGKSYLKLIKSLFVFFGI